MVGHRAIGVMLAGEGSVITSLTDPMAWILQLNSSFTVLSILVMMCMGRGPL